MNTQTGLTRRDKTLLFVAGSVWLGCAGLVGWGSYEAARFVGGVTVAGLGPEVTAGVALGTAMTLFAGLVTHHLIAVRDYERRREDEERYW